ncbi:MAG TPA: bacteriohopanetetrol glucosamine biosynthesis glycosyltransferase HpnI [Terriglobales bacterium]|nr:bacteriohopanetetrol glucosamine biosynthesis glycosyltransferase HpnI [Terriglobales bacterium]
MMQWMMWAGWFCGAMALGALAFHLLCLLGAWDFHRQKNPASGALPAVSILKPLKGADPEMYESFRSHCLQEYPDYEIIFGVNGAADEAVAYVTRLQQEFPQRAIRLIVCSEVLGANRKVSNLAQMLAQAKHEHVLINDSDIRVPADYLRDVMAWFAEPNAGMVTCMYRAIAGKTVWSKIESLGVTMDFMPPVLAARFLEGRVYFGLGSTMAVSKEAVRAMGGLESIADHLADDYELGTRIADAGLKVVLADVVVETFVPEYSVKEFFDHQLRWGRTIRSSRPGGYAGIVITFGFFWSLLAMVSSGGAWWSVGLFVANVIARLVVTQVVGVRIVGHRAVWSLMWLMPLRDLLSPFIWLLSLGGSRIVWRGETFSLHKGKLVRR